MELIHSVISRDEYNTVNQLYCNKGNFKNESLLNYISNFTHSRKNVRKTFI